MAPKYTILFVVIDAVGHVNACLGIAEQLRDRGHKVVFATPNTWKGRLEALGFAEELYTVTEQSLETDGDPWAKMLAKTMQVIPLPSIEHQSKMHLEMHKEFFGHVQHQEPRFREIMKSVKPDVLVIDYMAQLPSFMNQGTPYILSCSCNPLGISDVNVPPAFSGYPTDGDRQLWKDFRDEVARVYKDLYDDYTEWVLNNGGPKMSIQYPFWVKYSPWANIYMYPIELDYTSFRPNPPNWYQFDTFVRNGEGDFEIPLKLAGGKGKLIYFSMGTIGCVDVDLMKRLISILAKSPNRFIVSKGPRADEFELADNMWGERSVPQTKVLPLVDLVITHGGNNTITESFYFGKRVLVLPLLWDQLDNGQRIEETGLGRRCYPYTVTEEELLTTIEKMLADEMLERRMRSISKRIQSSNSQSRAADLVERIAAQGIK